MSEAWPALPYAAWQPTGFTLHMWTQVVGEVRLARSPHVNHWWQVPLYVSARGLTTTAIPYRDDNFECEFDFVDHVLAIRKSDGASRTIKLAPKSVAAFHTELMATLRSLGIEARIWTMPQEVPDPIPFERDTAHASYDLTSAARFWRALQSVDAVLKEFRANWSVRLARLQV